MRSSVALLFSSRLRRYGSSLLRLQYVVLVDPPASKEAVAHHLLAKQKNEADQDGQREGTLRFPTRAIVLPRGRWCLK